MFLAGSLRVFPRYYSPRYSRNLAHFAYNFPCFVVMVFSFHIMCMSVFWCHYSEGCERGVEFMDVVESIKNINFVKTISMVFILFISSCSSVTHVCTRSKLFSFITNFVYYFLIKMCILFSLVILDPHCASRQLPYECQLSSFSFSIMFVASLSILEIS